jgi:beta-glucosidase
MSMPGDVTFSSGTSWWGKTLVDFVQNGTIPEARVDDMGEDRTLTKKASS